MHVLLLTVSLLGLAMPVAASAIDFKIDIPPLNNDQITAMVPLEPLSSPAPLNISPAKSFKNETKFSQQPPAKNESFPYLKCLSHNINFWKKIYLDVDGDEAVFHDRQKMDRIYGIVRLPKSASERSLTLKTARAFYENKLNIMADTLNNSSQWDSTMMQLKTLFSKAELNPQDLRTAAANLRIQTGLKTRFEEGVQRSLSMIPTIKAVLKQQNLPPDLVYLPHVESSYHPFARSRVGAVGLWQIMPGTMRILEGSRAIGQRTNVALSTKAAAKLLRINYEQVQSWPLAITAYNHGLAGVQRAIKATGSSDLCTIISNYASPSFQFASSNFYAQFIAAKIAAELRYRQLAQTNTFKKILNPLLAATETFQSHLK